MWEVNTRVHYNGNRTFEDLGVTDGRLSSVESNYPHQTGTRLWTGKGLPGLRDRPLPRQGLVR